MRIQKISLTYKGKIPFECKVCGKKFKEKELIVVITFDMGRRSSWDIKFYRVHFDCFKGLFWKIISEVKKSKYFGKDGYNIWIKEKILKSLK